MRYDTHRHASELDMGVQASRSHACQERSRGSGITRAAGI